MMIGQYWGRSMDGTKSVTIHRQRTPNSASIRCLWHRLTTEWPHRLTTDAAWSSTVNDVISTSTDSDELVTLLDVLIVTCRVCYTTSDNDWHHTGHWTEIITTDSLTLSPPIPLRLYTLPHWSNPPLLIFDIRALWRSRLSARAPECQKLKMVG